MSGVDPEIDRASSLDEIAQELPFLRHRQAGSHGLFGEAPNDTFPTGAWRDMWEERGTYVQTEPYEVSAYELDGGTMKIRDVLWGDMTIDGGASRFDALLMQLARSPLLRRTQGIEQLTLGKNFATMPNSNFFSRWSHIWGSLMFVRKMNEGRDIDPRENEVMQLRTLLSDVGHTAFSHLGDWMFQADGSGEDLHDKELKDILTVTGIADLLNEFGYSLEETVFPEVEDWVECPAPDLCVDRVDYGLREMVRWQGPITNVQQYNGQLEDPQSLFEIIDGRLAIKNPDFATRFAAGYSLLPTEHWSHPVHRLQLQLFQLAMRRILSGHEGHPRDVLYGVDANFEGELLTWDVTNVVDSMRSIGLAQRRLFASGRQHDLAHTFRPLNGMSLKVDKDYVFPAFPDPLSVTGWQAQEFVIPYSPNLVIESTNVLPVDPIQVVKNGLQFALPALKSRVVDPLVRSNDEPPKPLSEYNPSYVPYLQGQQQEMAKNYLVTMLLHPQFAQSMFDQYTESLHDWQQITTRPRSKEALEKSIEDGHWWGGATRFDYITDW